MRQSVESSLHSLLALGLFGYGRTTMYLCGYAEVSRHSSELCPSLPFLCMSAFNMLKQKEGDFWGHTQKSNITAVPKHAVADCDFAVGPYSLPVSPEQHSKP